MARGARAEASPARYWNLGEQEPPDAGSRPIRVRHGNELGCIAGADPRSDQDARIRSTPAVLLTDSKLPVAAEFAPKEQRDGARIGGCSQPIQQLGFERQRLLLPEIGRLCEMQCLARRPR